MGLGLVTIAPLWPGSSWGVLAQMHYGWQSPSVWIILMLLSSMGGNAAFEAGLRTMQLLFGLAYVGATAHSLRHDLSLAQTFHRLLCA